MIDTATNKLGAELARAGIPVDIHDGHIEYRTDQVWLSIEKRPHYCDRGKWIVKVTPEGPPFLLSYDHADGFPRYYFHDDSLVREIRTWLERRELV